MIRFPLLVVGGLPVFAEDTPGPVTRENPYSQYPGQDFPNQVFFGGTHGHTLYSTDSHTGLSTVEADNFFGKGPLFEPSADPIRVSGGFDFAKEDLVRADVAKHAYESGVPMGGDPGACVLVTNMVHSLAQQADGARHFLPLLGWVHPNVRLQKDPRQQAPIAGFSRPSNSQ
ncbi:MAG: hypothetical protein ACR2RV_09310 [Verrucomicrobiales bacterium]